MAEISTAAINDLPDDAFAYIEPGGSKDAEGKTAPRSLRHFPIHDAAHVRNALARASKSPFGEKAMPKIQAAAKKFGVDAAERSSFQPPFEGGGPVSRSVLPGPGYVEPEAKGQRAHLVGSFAPYDEWAEINSRVEGHFLERHERSAWSQSLQPRHRSSLRVLFHHGEHNQTGVLPLGEIERLEEGPRAVDYDVALFDDTDYVQRLLPAMRSGQFGTSWTFHPVKGKFTVDPKPKRSSYNPEGIPEVTHHEIRMVEFGPCMFPAYSGATAGVRSMTDYYLRERLGINVDPETLQQVLTHMAVPPIISAETALSDERAEGEPHSGAESSKVPLVPVHQRFKSDQEWLDWCRSVLK